MVQSANDEVDGRSGEELLADALQRSTTLVAKIQQERDDLAARAQADPSLAPGVVIMDKALAATTRMLENLRAAEKVAPWNDTSANDT